MRAHAARRAAREPLGGYNPQPMLRFRRCLAPALALCMTAGACRAPSATGGPAVDEAELAQAVAAVRSVDADMRPRIALKALEEVERSRLDHALLEGLAAMTEAPPEQRTRRLSKAFSEQMSLADEVCAGDAQAVLTEVAAVAPERRSALVLDGCRFESRGLMTRAELERAEPLTAWLAHMIHAELSSHGDLAPGEVELIEALASTPAQP